MIVRLSAELFDATTPDEHRLLRRLLLRLDEDVEKHALLLEPQDEPLTAPGRVHAWLRSLGNEDNEDRRIFLNLHEMGPLVEDLRHSGEASRRDGCWRRSGPLKIRVERRAVSDWRRLLLTLSDALDLLREPVHLVLENSRNDFHFLYWLGNAEFRRALKGLDDAPNALRVSGAGTGELESYLRALAERESLDPAQLRRLWKTWVMFDRDAGELDAREASETIARLISYCEAICERTGVPLNWVCLQRREIESYLPDTALRRARNRSAGDALRRMRERSDRATWAWAYDMKRGLRGDLLGTVAKGRRDQLSRRGQVPQPYELKRPFDQLDDQARRGLAHGFGEDVLNHPLSADSPPAWLDELSFEYGRGPDHQIPLAELLQSIFDKV